MRSSALFYLAAIITFFFSSIPPVKDFYYVGLFSERPVILSASIIIIPLLIALIFMTRRKFIGST